MPTLSIIVIAKNESRNIGRCLRSVAGWADEIIVLDSGSADNTIEICHRYTSQVYMTDWPGYGPQKQRALDLARGDWVLSLDADEWIRPNLRQEIQSVIKESVFPGYYLPRLTMYCGQFQKYGDASKDKVLRLFLRNNGRFTDDKVHEKIICTGQIGVLSNPLLHNAYRTYEEWTAQMHHYAILTAKLRHSKGCRSNPIKALFNSLWIFFRSYIWRQGFRDGRVGYWFAKLNAVSSFQRNLVLWKLNTKSAKIKTNNQKAEDKY